MAKEAAARGSNTDVRTGVIIIMYEALRRVLQNPSDAPVKLLIFTCLFTITIKRKTGLRNKKAKN